jgi:hypothetical protein
MKGLNSNYFLLRYMCCKHLNVLEKPKFTNVKHECSCSRRWKVICLGYMQVQKGINGLILFEASSDRRIEEYMNMKNTGICQVCLCKTKENHWNSHLNGTRENT